MNDNYKLPLARLWERSQFNKREAEQVRRVALLASRAVTKPEGLRLDEIQELGWGFLMATVDRLRMDVERP